VMTEKKKQFGDAFKFWPKGFNLDIPEQYEYFKSIYAEAERLGKPGPIYIIKRPMLAQGEGIHLVASLKEVEEMNQPGSSCYPLDKHKPLAQEYITNVLLLEGHKVTLRVYATITSFDPLRLYIFHNGLVRICSRPYRTDTESLKDIFTHVDSINLNEENEHEWLTSAANSTLEYEGLRVEIKHLVKRLDSQGRNGTKMWKDVKNLILMSILGAESRILPQFKKICTEGRNRRLSPWEMVGYDVLIDDELNVFLLEINNTPSLAPHTDLENKIKKSLVHDLFTLVDVENKDFFKLPDVVDEKWNHLQQYPKDYMLESSSGKTFNMSHIKSKDDMWAIVETEMENKRVGHFERTFPVPKGDNYLKYSINPRNKLVIDWLNSGNNVGNIKSFFDMPSMTAS